MKQQTKEQIWKASKNALLEEKAVLNFRKAETEL